MGIKSEDTSPQMTAASSTASTGRPSVAPSLGDVDISDIFGMTSPVCPTIYTFRDFLSNRLATPELVEKVLGRLTEWIWESDLPKELQSDDGSNS